MILCRKVRIWERLEMPFLVRGNSRWVGRQRNLTELHNRTPQPRAVGLPETLLPVSEFLGSQYKNKRLLWCDAPGSAGLGSGLQDVAIWLSVQCEPTTLLDCVFCFLLPPKPTFTQELIFPQFYCPSFKTFYALWSLVIYFILFYSFTLKFWKLLIQLVGAEV